MKVYFENLYRFSIDVCIYLKVSVLPLEESVALELDSQITKSSFIKVCEEDSIMLSGLFQKKQILDVKYYPYN